MNTKFETWWKNDAQLGTTTKKLCRMAWENGAYCALNPVVIYNDCPDDPDDDFNEPLGQACQLGDETCESCQ